MQDKVVKHHTGPKTRHWIAITTCIILVTELCRVCGLERKEKRQRKREVCLGRRAGCHDKSLDTVSRPGGHGVLAGSD